MCDTPEGRPEQLTWPDARTRRGSEAQPVPMPKEVGTGTALESGPRMAVPSDPPPRVASGTMVRQARILIVDDEPLVAQSLRLVLSREFSVTTTTDPAEAFEWIASGESFDVILCDVMMPGMNGVELRARIQTIEPDQAARMVFVTGGILLPHVRALLEGVPNVWIEKPIDLEGLRESGPPPHSK